MKLHLIVLIISLALSPLGVAADANIKPRHDIVLNVILQAKDGPKQITLPWTIFTNSQSMEFSSGNGLTLMLIVGQISEDSVDLNYSLTGTPESEKASTLQIKGYAEFKINTPKSIKIDGKDLISISLEKKK